MNDKLIKCVFLGNNKGFGEVSQITCYGRVVKEEDLVLTLAYWDLPENDSRETNWECFKIIKNNIIEINELKPSRSKKPVKLGDLVQLDFLDHVKDSESAFKIEAYGILLREDIESLTLVSLDFQKKELRDESWVLFTILKSTVKNIQKLREVHKKPKPTETLGA